MVGIFDQEIEAGRADGFFLEKPVLLCFHAGLSARQAGFELERNFWAFVDGTVNGPFGLAGRIGVRDAVDLGGPSHISWIARGRRALIEGVADLVVAKVFDANAADAEAILGGGSTFAAPGPTGGHFGFLFERGARLVRVGTLCGARFDHEDFVGFEDVGDGTRQIRGHAHQDGFELDLELLFDEIDFAGTLAEGFLNAVGVRADDDLDPVGRELGADVLAAQMAVIGFAVPGVPGFFADGGVEVLEEEVLVFGVAFAPDIDATFLCRGTGVGDFVLQL